MFSVLHSDIDSLKSGLLHLTGQLKERTEKSKMELETKVLETIVLNDTL
jgi:hypothetical protein